MREDRHHPIFGVAATYAKKLKPPGSLKEPGLS